MVSTNKRSTTYIHTIKKKEFKLNIKDSHQIIREPKRKGRKKDLPKKYRAINYVSKNIHFHNSLKCTLIQCSNQKT